MQKCGDLDARLDAIDQDAAALEARVKAKRKQNQVAGYFGALFIFPLVGVDGQPEVMDRLDRLQAERDQIYVAKRRMACPNR